MAIVGLISDTHGLMRDEALEALAGSDFIIHAGDIGGEEILASLRSIAPVTAVRGNNDHGAWAAQIPESDVLEVGRCLIYVLHALEDLDLDPQAAGFHAVISGHSHRPLIRQRDGVLYVNPGSAGPRRFTLPISVGRLEVDDGTLRPQIVELSIAKRS